MTVTVDPAVRTADPWRGFTAGGWQDRVDVADFVRANVRPFAGDASFLTGPSQRTRRVWHKVGSLFPAERERGILDVDTATPSEVRVGRSGCRSARREGRDERVRPPRWGQGQSPSMMCGGCTPAS